MAGAEFESLYSNYDQSTLDDIHAESEKILGESKTSALHIEQCTENIKSIGLSTLVKLYDQGEKIDHISKQVDHIDDHLDDGARQMTSIESIFGSIRNKFVKRSSKKHSSVEIPIKRPVKTIDDNYISTNIKKYNGDMYDHLSPHAQQDAKDIDVKLTTISKNLDQIKDIADAMGKEIDDHNHQLLDINNNVHTTTVKVKKVSKRVVRQF